MHQLSRYLAGPISRKSLTTLQLIPEGNEKDCDHYVQVKNSKNYIANTDFNSGSLSLSNCYVTPQARNRLMRYYLLENG